MLAAAKAEIFEIFKFFVDFKLAIVKKIYAIR